MLLGCIADDLTGATDLALMLTRGGMRTVQVMAPPDASTDLAGFDAVVVALKTRTCSVAEAVALSLASADALLARGAKQLFFKYCSTFDSTEHGNIGPVADALMDKLGADFAIVCPAFPTNKRTVYMGNLFVDEQPLAESPMRDHPLTPMRDSNLVRLLARQTKRNVGLIPFGIVTHGPDAIARAFGLARRAGVSYVVVDAITDQNLRDMAFATASHKLITGGSGVALGLPDIFITMGLMQAAPVPQTMAAPPGRAAIIAGSCSAATRAQIAAARAAGIPALQIKPAALATGDQDLAAGVNAAIAWAKAQPPAAPVLIYSSADPNDVRAAQDELGRERAGHLIEQALAAIAFGLAAAGFTRLIVAGGETSGAVVTALGVKALEIGPEIDPGVPWTRAIGGVDLVLALKSGNFGTPDFFSKAWAKLGTATNIASECGPVVPAR